MGPHDFRAIYLTIGIVNLAILAGFALILARDIWPDSAPFWPLQAPTAFDLQSRAPVLATWYSASLTVAVAVVATINHWMDLARSATASPGRRFLRHGWMLLAVGALYISLDESLELHEDIAVWLARTGRLHFPELTANSPIYLWLVFLAPIMLAVGLVLLAFFLWWLAIAPRARFLASVGMVAWLAVPALEYLESRLEVSFGLRGASISRFFEESLEIWGATLLFMGALEYLAARSASRGSDAPERSPLAAGVLDPD